MDNIINRSDLSAVLNCVEFIVYNCRFTTGQNLFVVIHFFFHASTLFVCKPPFVSSYDGTGKNLFAVTRM